MPATLFDFNGVLVDDEKVHLAAFREALAPLGVTITDDEYVERYLGFDDIGAFRAILTDRGRAAGDAEVHALVEAKKPFYMRRAERELIVFDGAVTAVRAAAALGPVGIVSGALRHEIDFALDKMDVREAISFVVSAEDTTRGKPDPEGYRLGLAALAQRGHGAPARPGHGAQPGATSVLVVEDSLAGIEAARALGLSCVAVAHSYSSNALTQAGANWVLPTIASIDRRWLDEVGHATR